MHAGSHLLESCSTSLMFCSAFPSERREDFLIISFMSCSAFDHLISNSLGTTATHNMISLKGYGSKGRTSDQPTTALALAHVAAITSSAPLYPLLSHMEENHMYVFLWQIDRCFCDRSICKVFRNVYNGYFPFQEFISALVTFLLSTFSLFFKNLRLLSFTKSKFIF